MPPLLTEVIKVIISLKHVNVKHNQPVTDARQNHNHHARELHPQHLEHHQTAKTSYLLRTKKKERGNFQ